MIKFKRVEEWKVMYCEDLTEKDYLRMAPDSWFAGTSQEWYDVWDCSELEAAYQTWIKDHGEPTSEDAMLASSYMEQSVYYKDLIFDLIEGKKSLDEVKHIFQVNYEERGHAQ